MTEQSQCPFCINHEWDSMMEGMMEIILDDEWDGTKGISVDEAYARVDRNACMENICEYLDENPGHNHGNERA